MKLLQRTPPILVLIIAIFSVQLGAAMAKSLFAQFGPITVVFWRVTLAALMLLVITRPAIHRMTRSQWRVSLLFAVALITMNVTYYLSLERLPLGLAVTIEFIGPLAVAIWHSHRALDFVWVALAGLGIALLNPFSGHIDGIGFLLAIAAGVCWGLYIILGERLGNATPGSLGLTAAMTVGSLALIPVKEIVSPQWMDFVPALPLALGVAFLSSVVPYTCEIEALRRMPPRVFGILMSVEPACAAIVGWLALDEQLTLTQWLAVVAVMTASIGAARTSTPTGAPATPIDV